MLFVFSVVPHSSHLYSMVALANGLRSIGHEVVMATAGGAVDLASGAGLPVVDVVPTWEQVNPFQVFETEEDETVDASEHPVDQTPEELAVEIGEVFGCISDLMWDGLEDVVERWKPDAVVYSPLLPVAYCVARRLGIPTVLHNYGPARPTFMPAVEYLRGTKRADLLPDSFEADVAIDILPSSLETIHPEPVESGPAAEVVMQMGYRGFTGGAPIEPWILERPSRPRVVVTLGTPSAHEVAEEEPGLLERVIDSVQPLDVELVICGGKRPDGFDEEIRHVRWAPLATVLRTADVVVHHGGSGTALVAYAAGVPQLVVPDKGPGTAATEAEIAERRGLGVTVELERSDVQSLTEAIRLLLNGPHHLAAAEIRDEMAALPGPTSVAEQLTATIAAAQGNGG